MALAARASTLLRSSSYNVRTLWATFTTYPAILAGEKFVYLELLRLVFPVAPKEDEIKPYLLSLKAEKVEHPPILATTDGPMFVVEKVEMD